VSIVVDAVMSSLMVAVPSAAVVLYVAVATNVPEAPMVRMTTCASPLNVSLFATSTAAALIRAVPDRPPRYSLTARVSVELVAVAMPW
jgi:hypothetical protein